MTMKIKHPLSEQTLIKHNYEYNGIKYINDLGHPCEYRIEKDRKDLKTVIKYYKGRLLTEFGIID